MMVERRMLMSHSKIIVPSKTGRTCGRMPNSRIWKLVPPTARIASIGFGSTSSIASAMVFEMKPIERTAIASTPARAPRPTAETKIRPQTISCTERDIVIRKRPNAYERRAERRDVGGAQPRHRDREQQAGERGERRHQHGLDRRLHEFGQQREIDLEEARQRGARARR